MSERLPIPPVVSERPRERLLRHGTDALTSAELLAVILGTGLPGTPVLFYGEEIGMGENLALEGRMAVRTPMQWTSEPGAGFSTAPKRKPA